MNLDNGQLAAFAMALREGSFDAAAKRLHVTPSAISQRIRQLEEKLGQVLVQRSVPCQPTAAGRILARFAEQVVLLEAETLSAIGAPGGAGITHLRLPVAVNADSLDGWFLSVFELMPEALAVAFEIRVEDQDHTAELLREGIVMAAVSASPTAVQGCSVDALGVMRYRAVASPDYLRKYLPAGVSADSLARAPMLAFSRKDALQQRFVAELTGQSVQPPTHYLPSVHGFVDVVRRGLAWGMVPEHLLGDALTTGQLVDLAAGRWLDVPLYWHRWRVGSTALASLSEAVKKAAGSMLRAP